MTGLVLLLLAGAGVLLAAAKFLAALEVVDRAQADIGTDDGWYEDVDSGLLQRQEWDRPDLRSIQ